MRITVQERLFRKEKTRIEKRIEKIKYITSAKPLYEIIQLEEETIEECKKLPPAMSLLSIDKAQKKRSALMALAKDQSDNRIKYIDEEVSLNSELGELNRELYFIEQRRTK